MTTTLTRPDYRIRMQNTSEIRDAGKREAAGLLVALTSTSGDPAALLSEALSEIIGLAVENRIEESSARLEGFCEVLGPILVDALDTIDPKHSTITESEGGEL